MDNGDKIIEASTDISKEYKQIFNKVDLALRNIYIKAEHKVLKATKGLTAQQARQELSDRVYITWDGRTYMLSEKQIAHIIYDIPPICEVKDENISNRSRD